MADAWQISLDDDKIESLFSIDRGISLMMDGGWSELFLNILSVRAPYY